MIKLTSKDVEHIVTINAESGISYIKYKHNLTKEVATEEYWKWRKNFMSTNKYEKTGKIPTQNQRKYRTDYWGK